MVTRTFPKMSRISFYKDTLNTYVARRFKFKEFLANFASKPKRTKNSLTFKNNKILIHMQTSQQFRPVGTFQIMWGHACELWVSHLPMIETRLVYVCKLVWGQVPTVPISFRQACNQRWAVFMNLF